jgi:hypothetical protein
MNEFLISAATILENDVLVALFFFAGTAIVISLWIPGFLLPIAASSGAVLDAWSGSIAVACGALAGSMAIFATSRRVGQDRLPARLAGFLHRFEDQFRSHGAWCVLLLRLIGAPHFLVSGKRADADPRALFRPGDTGRNGSGDNLGGLCGFVLGVLMPRCFFTGGTGLESGQVLAVPWVVGNVGRPANR